MKTRQGFVSNSSATSFCIYGCCLDSDKWSIHNEPECFARFLKKFKQEFPVDYENALSEIREDENCMKYYSKQIEFAEKIDDYKIADANQVLSDGEERDYFDLELADKFLDHIGLERKGNSDMGIYIGQEWSTIKDDQTGAQFKLRIDELIQSLFGETCGTCEEAWADY